jgi:hypothetical protein
VASPRAQTSRFALDVVGRATSIADRRCARSHRRGSTLSAPCASDWPRSPRPAGGVPASFDGTWQTQLYELALRYERPGRSACASRPDTSVAVGLSILENRPNKNPVDLQHSTLYLPIPAIRAGTPTRSCWPRRIRSARRSRCRERSGTRARRCRQLADRGRPFFRRQPPRMANVVGGCGFTPYIGLRFGWPWHRRLRAEAKCATSPRRSPRHAAAGRRRVGVPLHAHRRRVLWTTRELATAMRASTAAGSKFTQTLSPRVFGVALRRSVDGLDERARHGPRTSRIGASKPRSGSGSRRSHLRASYMTRKGYVVGFWDDQVLASIVFAKRIR